MKYPNIICLGSLKDPKFEHALDQFCLGLHERLEAYKLRMGLTYFDHYAVQYEVLQVRVRICRVEMEADNTPRGSGTSLIGFVELATGDIMFPGGWKAPAKHARGNIYSAQQGMEAITHQGANIRALR